MASAWRSSMPAACNRLTAACVSSTRLFYELQLCRRDELAWYKSAVQEKARATNAGFGRENGRVFEAPKPMREQQNPSTPELHQPL